MLDSSDQRTYEALSAGLVPLEMHKTLTDRVYASIRGALLSGAFVPGQRMPIRDVADALGVSLTPAREALGRLVAERVLVSTPNKSVFVPSLTRQELAEIYQLRRMLEGFAAQEAVPKLGSAGLAMLEQTQVELVAAMDRKDYGQVLLKNQAFHFGLYAAAELPLGLQIIETLWLRIGPYLNLLYPEFGRNRRGVAHHAEALEGLRDGDPDAVRRAIEADLSDGERLLAHQV